MNLKLILHLVVILNILNQIGSLTSTLVLLRFTTGRHPKHSRESPDLKPSWQIISINIIMSNNHTVITGILLGHFVPFWRQSLAVSAPWCIELDKSVFGAIYM